MSCECGAEYNYQGICENCGLIDEELQADSLITNSLPLFREKPERAMTSLSMPNLAVSTIEYQSEAKGDFKRVLKTDVQPWEVKRFMILKTECDVICNDLKLPLKEDCYYWIHKMKKITLTGHKLEKLAPAVVLIAARMKKYPLLIEELDNVWENYNFLVSELGIKMKALTARDLIPKFVERILKGEPPHSKNYLIIQARILALGTSGNPKVVAAAAIYRVLKPHGFTQEAVCNACGCSEIGMRTRLKK